MEYTILNQEIAETQERLKRLQQDHDGLVNWIKEKTYPHSIYFPEENGKPRNTKEMMEAAICYFLKIYKHWPSDITLSQPWRHIDDLKQLSVYSFFYKDDQYTMSPINEFHHLVKIKLIWKWAIANDLSNLSLAAFTQQFKGRKLFNLLQKECSYHKPSPHHNNFFLLSVKELQIKDVVILAQSRKNSY
jgi:hypothetical protein